MKTRIQSERLFYRFTSCLQLQRGECGLRIADCGFMSLFNRGLETKIESFLVLTDFVVAL
jgi:hypothetical protein